MCVLTTGCVRNQQWLLCSIVLLLCLMHRVDASNSNKLLRGCGGSLCRKVAVDGNNNNDTINNKHNIHWFHAHSNGGKWSTKDDGRTLRYDMEENSLCNNESTTIPITTVVDSSFTEIPLHKDSVFIVTVEGKTTMTKRRKDGPWKNSNEKVDVLNVYLNGNWIYQATGVIIEEENNDNQQQQQQQCQMGSSFVVTRNVPRESIITKNGPNAVSIEIITNKDAYHVGAYYEVTISTSPPLQPDSNKQIQ